MDSITSLSAADVRRLFSEDAVLFIEDAVVGERVKEMQQRGFPIESADGLDFCKLNVFDDPVCRKHLLTQTLANIPSACPARSRGHAPVARPRNLRSVPDRPKLHLRFHDGAKL